MANVLYRNAVLLIGDADIRATLTELGLDYSAEMLDATVMGNDTRVRKGGLKTAKISGKAVFDTTLRPTDPVEAVLFGKVGVDETLLTVFPDGITPGSVTNMGYAMKGTFESFVVGGTVGSLLGISFSAEHVG